MATKGLLNWSTTAATNATADSQAQFAEGQAPSSLNDGIRGLMSSMALWRNDVSGSITTGGTSTAYTATTNQDATTLAQLNAQIITIVPHATNGADPTLAVNGLTAKQIRTATGVNVASGTMVAGTPYQLVYFSSAGEFILMNFSANPYQIPIGGFLPYMGTTAPNSNFAMPYGQAISRTTYATLYGLPGVGTAHGIGDGSTTYNLPDLRDRTIAFWGSMGGSAASRLTNQTGGLEGDTVGATGGTETHTLTEAQLAAHTHGGATGSDGAHTHTYSYQAGNSIFAGGGSSGAWQNITTATTSSNGAHTHTIASAGSGTAHNNVQPTIILPCILRII